MIIILNVMMKCKHTQVSNSYLATSCNAIPVVCSFIILQLPRQRYTELILITTPWGHLLRLHGSPSITLSTIYHTTTNVNCTNFNNLNFLLTHWLFSQRYFLVLFPLFLSFHFSNCTKQQ